jgi:hypothetical protein
MTPHHHTQVRSRGEMCRGEWEWVERGGERGGWEEREAERCGERWRVGEERDGDVLFQVRVAALKRYQSIFRYLKLNKFVVPPPPGKLPQQTMFLRYLNFL